MTLQECTALLAPFAVALRTDFDKPTFKAYHKLLAKVPAALFEAALERISNDGLRFMPTAPELLTACERTRRQLLALHPWEPCVECEGWPGRREVLIDGVQRMERCPCRDRHSAFLDARGLKESVASLPGEAGVGENEQVFPTLEQLPTQVRNELGQIANRKLLR